MRASSALVFGAAALFSFLSSCKSRQFNAVPSASFSPGGVPTDWGVTSVSSGVKAEANLANVAAARISMAASVVADLGLGTEFKAHDGVVAIPVNLKNSDIKPFGDGQTNSSPFLPGWTANGTVPVASTWFLISDSSSKIHNALMFDLSSDLVKMFSPGATKVEIEVSGEGLETKIYSMNEVAEEGVWRTFLLKSDLLQKVGYQNPDYGSLNGLPDDLENLLSLSGKPKVKVRPVLNDKKENRFFPILWRFPAKKQQDSFATLSPNHKFFSSGKSAIDVPFDASDIGNSANERLTSWGNRVASTLAYQGYNSSVHSEFKEPGTSQSTTTAVGGVQTWVVGEKLGGTEVLYTCFDARDKDKEAEFSVPSGAGWHSIGEPTNAETIINNLESEGIFSGWGVEVPYPFAEEAPFEAKDVATFRVLRAGESFTTLQNDFHWYAVDTADKVCTTILKHGCSIVSDTNLSCH